MEKELILETKVCRTKLMAIHDTMDIINGKWKVSIIACLCAQPMRFSELLREVNGISGKMLSRELKDLEINQLIERKVFNTQPVTVIYEITEYGISLQDVTEVIADWGIQHRKNLFEEKKETEILVEA